MEQDQDLLQSQPPSTQASQQEEVPIPNLEDLPSIETIHKTYIPTFTWIPKAARADFSRVFSELCNRVASNPDNISSWILQLMFIRSILPAVKGRHDTVQSKVVKERLSRW